jgi:hypothetical protein
LKSTKYSVKSRITAANFLAIIGYGAGNLVLLSILYAFVDGEDATASEFILPVVCMFLFYLMGMIGGAQKKYIKRYQMYNQLIGNYRIVAIDYLANSTSQTVEFIQNDLQNMIKAQLFLNAHVNLETNEIVFQEGVGTIASTETVDVACPSCGANNNKSKYRSSACAYCGTEL